MVARTVPAPLPAVTALARLRPRRPRSPSTRPSTSPRSSRSSLPELRRKSRVSSPVLEFSRDAGGSWYKEVTPRLEKRTCCDPGTDGTREKRKTYTGWRLKAVDWGEASRSSCSSGKRTYFLLATLFASLENPQFRSAGLTRPLLVHAQAYDTRSHAFQRTVQQRSDLLGRES